MPIFAYRYPLKKTYSARLSKSTELLQPLLQYLTEQCVSCVFVPQRGLYLTAIRQLDTDVFNAPPAELMSLRNMFNKRPEPLELTIPSKLREIRQELAGGRFHQGIVLADIFEREPTIFFRVAHSRMYPKSAYQSLDLNGKYQGICLIDYARLNPPVRITEHADGYSYPVLAAVPADLIPAFEASPVFMQTWLATFQNLYGSLLRFDDVEIQDWTRYRNIFIQQGEHQAFLNMISGPNWQGITPAMLRGSHPFTVLS